MAILHSPLKKSPRSGKGCGKLYATAQHSVVVREMEVAKKVNHATPPRNRKNATSLCGIARLW